jgi:hypothetical protein
MYPYAALRCPHTAKIHTLITLGIRHRLKSLVLKARKKCPCGFDSHRPLHFPATFQQSTWRSIRFGSNRLRERSIRAARRPSTISMRAENVLCIAFYTLTRMTWAEGDTRPPNRAYGIFALRSR